ncbi:MAG TPA: hypothetical protein VGQ20_09000 [Acidimicrobiales bacterium]|jgi:zinc transporter ZupT|nr:hypothetical protein [Acidimicrobiales bacterium]
MSAVTSSAAGARRLAWPVAVLPLTGLALLFLFLAGSDPLRPISATRPVEAVAVERTKLSEGTIELQLRNDGQSGVTIAQVLVNDAYWEHTITRRDLGRLQTATVRIGYPWEEGLPLHVVLVTSTGTVIDHDIEVATVTPRFDVHTFARYGLLGVLIGVAPIALGLLWLPTIRRVSPRSLVFLLAFAVGLLAVLLADTVREGLELAARAPASLRGVEVFVATALAVLAVLAGVDRAIAGRHDDASVPAGLAAAYLVATGIGLHNLGEGLAVGAAVATGELALGSSLLIGFAAHNSTEGLAIAGPLALSDRQVPGAHLVALVGVAGLPAVLGAWMGGLAVTSLWATAAMGMAAGAIIQVILIIGRRIIADNRGVSPPASAGFVAGLVVMYLTGLLAAS